MGRQIDRLHSRNVHKDFLLHKVFINIYICVSLSREGTEKKTVLDSVKKKGRGGGVSFHFSTDPRNAGKVITHTEKSTSLYYFNPQLEKYFLLIFFNNFVLK